MYRIWLDNIGNLSSELYDFLSKNDLETLEEGTYHFKNGCYVNVESYITQSFDERKYESHDKYVDIQYIISGEEKIIIAPVNQLECIKEYDSNKDIRFYNNDLVGEEFVLQSGEALVIYPEEGHMPCLMVNSSRRVKKSVFKIPIIMMERNDA